MTLRILYDAVLPQSLAEDAPSEVQLLRWEGNVSSDADLVGEAVKQDCRAVLLFERDSLQQPELRKVAHEAGVALAAVEATDPIDAKQRILNNLAALRRKLGENDCVLILANEVRPIEGGD
jgi:hypothetical protein